MTLGFTDALIISAWRFPNRSLCLLSAELDRTRTIGVEHEFSLPVVSRTSSAMDAQHAIAEVLTANGIRAIARGYSHAPVPEHIDIAVETDSSVQGESRYAGVRWMPIEIKSRILHGIDDWESIMPKTLEICRYLGGRCTPSAGHHVHLGFGEFKQDPSVVRSLWNLFHRYDNLLFGLQPPSRRDNTYCAPMPSATKLLHGANSLRTIKQRLSHYGRYQALNLVHLFNDSPHIELRHAASTLDAAKARHWLRIAMRLVGHSVVRNCQAAPASLPNDRQTLDRFLVTIGLKVNSKVYASVSPELRETGRWTIRRWKSLNEPISLRKAEEPQMAEL